MIPSLPSARLWPLAGVLTYLLLVPVGCSDTPAPPQDLGPGGDQGDGKVWQDTRSDAKKACTLKISTINGKAATSSTLLTAADDTDVSKPGLQVDLLVTGTNLLASEDVTLTVTGLSQGITVKPQGQKVDFKSVTINATVRQVTFKVSSVPSSCKGDQLVLWAEPPPECNFVAPLDGATLGKKDDKTSGNTTFDYDVRVATVNAGGASAGTVALTIDGQAAGTAVPDAKSGLAVFSDKVLPLGTGKVLQAKVTVSGVSRTCKSTVAVDTNAPSCSVSFSPAPLDLTAKLGALGFGQAQDAKTSTSGLETDVIVQTATGSVDVTLLVDKVSAVPAVSTTTGKATFSAVALKDGSHTIEAVCIETSGGNQGKSGEIDILVDTVGPDAVNDTSDLSCEVADSRKGKVTLVWTAVGDTSPGSGVDVYHIRYRTDAACTDSNWSSSDTVKAVSNLVAYPKGATQTTSLTSLPLGKTYYICLKALDAVKNEASKVAKCSALKVDFNQLILSGISSAAGWGAQMASGDFNCDGKWDLAVGDSAANSGKGAVYLYLGNANGFLATPEKAFVGTVAGGAFGAAVSALSNFDNDALACTDLAVYASHGGSSSARVYIYLGRQALFNREDVTTGIGADLYYQVVATSGQPRIGPALASAGDFDAGTDGASDLALSWVDDSSGAASVLVIYGDNTLLPISGSTAPTVKNLPAAAGVQITGGTYAEGFGLSLAHGALLDSDSYADLIIGAKGTKVSGTTRGAVHVVKGAARPTTLPEIIAISSSSRVVTIQGGAANSALGSAVGFVGDMDKDGYNEFAVGDPEVSSKTGTVYLFNLKSTTPPASPSDAVAEVKNDVSGATGDQFGAALACAGLVDSKKGVDLDLDGYADLVAASSSFGTTAAGAVFFIGGGASLSGLSTSTASYTFTLSGGTSFGQSVVLAKDVDGKGYADVVVSDPAYSSGSGRFVLFY